MLSLKFESGSIAALFLLTSMALGHDGPHGHSHPAPLSGHTAILRITDATTGQAPYVFRARSTDIPDLVQKNLHRAHGGFAVDRSGDGVVYFSLPGAGLLRLGSELKSVEIVGGDPLLSDCNLHNTCLFEEGGRKRLALPSDNTQRVFITDLSGKILKTLENPYQDPAKAFRVCDVECIDGILIAANGYADNVCFFADTAASKPSDSTQGVWLPKTFGGMGALHGQFGTAHGVTRVPNTSIYTISDRANSRLESFVGEGRFVGGIELPKGSMPCDVDYLDSLAVVGCLKGPDGSTPAPIYIMEHGNIVSELNVGKDLGLEGFTHIHNAAIVKRKEIDGRQRLFVIAYAWNPGNLVILEQVLEGD